MVMSWIWTGLLCISVFCAILTGRGDALAAAIPGGAQAGITLALSLAGSLCLWTGVGRLLEYGGITAFFSRLIAPVLYRLFPGAKTDALLAGELSGNICANFLGLGNAATPLGIRAARGLCPPGTDRAGDSLCRLVVLNTASIQLLPTTVAAIRASLGCERPFDILPAVWITSFLSASLGLGMAVFLGKVWRND